MLAHLGFVLLLLAAGGRCDDTVAATVGRHTMGRIAELLAGSECHQLQVELNSPDEELGMEELGVLEPEHLPEENPPIRSRRGCSEALRHWLVTAGEVATWDRLVRGLQQIGRSDIARELGKNLNQDRRLQLRRNVAGYSRSVQHLSSAQLQPRGARARRAPRDPELLFERHRPPQYGRGLLGWLRPVVLGVLGAFLSSVLLTAAAVFACRCARLLRA